MDRLSTTTILPDTFQGTRDDITGQIGLVWQQTKVPFMVPLLKLLVVVCLGMSIHHHHRNTSLDQRSPTTHWQSFFSLSCWPYLHKSKVKSLIHSLISWDIYTRLVWELFLMLWVWDWVIVIWSLWGHLRLEWV